MDKAEFKKRFIGKMMAVIGEYEPWMEFSATAAYVNYKADPEDLTPEGHADAEVEEWSHDL